MIVRTFGLLALLGAVACGADARADLPVRGRVVDRFGTREAAVRRFHEGLTPTDSLSGGARSRDGLVAAFVRALSVSDTAALDRLAITRTEFAYLYYPSAAESRPPYDLEPGLMWFMQFERSNQGVRKALTRYGGRPMELLDHDCDTKARREGENVIHGPCTLRWKTATADTVHDRLFSRILERDGRFKFLSYANRLD